MWSYTRTKPFLCMQYLTQIVLFFFFFLQQFRLTFITVWTVISRVFYDNNARDLTSEKMQVHTCSSCLVFFHASSLHLYNRANRATVLRINRCSSCPLLGQHLVLCNQTLNSVLIVASKLMLDNYPIILHLELVQEDSYILN